MPEANPVIEAIRTRKGLAAILGAKLGITREAVWMWERVPPRHGPRVARIMKLPLKSVCPEMFPPPRKVREDSSSTQT